MTTLDNIGDTMNVFVIGVGAEIDPGELRSIGRTKTIVSKDPTKVRKAFEELGQIVEDYAKCFYLLSYCSPARAGEHELEVEAKPPGRGSGRLSYHFNASGFSPNCQIRTVSRRRRSTCTAHARQQRRNRASPSSRLGSKSKARASPSPERSKAPASPRRARLRRGPRRGALPERGKAPASPRRARPSRRAPTGRGSARAGQSAEGPRRARLGRGPRRALLDGGRGWRQPLPETQFAPKPKWKSPPPPSRRVPKPELKSRAPPVGEKDAPEGDPCGSSRPFGALAVEQVPAGATDRERFTLSMLRRRACTWWASWCGRSSRASACSTGCRWSCRWNSRDPIELALDRSELRRLNQAFPIATICCCCATASKCAVSTS